MATTNGTGYSQQSNSDVNGPPVSGGAVDADTGGEDGAWTLEQCVDSYLTYLMSKRAEIDEQQQARRYRHGSHWTAEQIKILNDRKQPVVTSNRIGRKIDGIVGLVEKLRQDPKAYPRTPEHQEGADLATAALRYVMDVNRWPHQKAMVAEKAAVDGIGGIELDLKEMPPAQGDDNPMANNGKPDYDVVFRVVDNDGFFYDPRSYANDFEDARYQGVGKWVDQEMLKEMLPDKADEIDSDASSQNASYLSTDSDRDIRWFQSNPSGKIKQVRLIDVWYKSKGKWRWSLFTRAAILKQGESPFYDDEDKQICRYQMFSAQVDHEGDRYGFPRNLMSAQDEINQRRSKALHLNNSRRIRATRAAIADDDVEALRREAARSDGIIVSNTSIEEIQFDDSAKQAQMMAEIEFLKDAKAEIENFGPNPALLGNAGMGESSGKAIALMQQAGVAELGPYMLNLRAWTLRVYRALFNAVQKYWTNERWIRVTDNQGVEQYVKINATQFHPETGMPTMVNVIGELDVDIILDEGPDTITMMADTYEAISQALPSVAKILSPPQAQAVMEVLIETSPLPADVKKKFRDAGQQQPQQGPSPEEMKAQAEVAILQQKNQGQLQLKRESAQIDAQTKQSDAAAEIQIAREKAQNEMEIEKMKATNQMEIERHKGLEGANIKSQLALHEASLQPPPEPEPAPKAAEPTPPPPAPPPDHTPAILELIKHLGSQKRPTGLQRTGSGMRVVYDGEG
jgi:hypothetical protein